MARRGRAAGGPDPEGFGGQTFVLELELGDDGILRLARCDEAIARYIGAGSADELRGSTSQEFTGHDPLPELVQSALEVMHGRPSDAARLRLQWIRHRRTGKQLWFVQSLVRTDDRHVRSVLKALVDDRFTALIQLPVAEPRLTRLVPPLSVDDLDAAIVYLEEQVWWLRKLRREATSRPPERRVEP